MEDNPAAEASDDADPTLGATLKMSPSRMQGLLAAGSDGMTAKLRGWQPPTVADLQRLLPQYEIKAFLARGGMGAVYQGVQRSLDRQVAIKILPPEMIEEDAANYAERFKQEARAMAKFKHPGIVTVYEAGETAEGLLYFVMEFVEGTDVAQLVAAQGRLPPEQALAITKQVCEALAYAHSRGVVHRDIKPSNVMIDADGQVKVADFGLAKMVTPEAGSLTQSNVAMGTPDFVAPEALIGGTLVDQRADIYAVGVMLYQMLTGQLPRGRFAPVSTIVPKSDPKLDAIVDKAMQTDRERRYSSALELKQDVENVTQESAGPPYGISNLVGEAARTQAHKRARVSAAMFAVVLLLGAGAIFFAFKAKPDSGQTEAHQSAKREWQQVVMPVQDWLDKSHSTLNASGELHVGEGLSLPGIRARNLSLRGEYRLTEASANTYVQLRKDNGGARHLAIHPGERVVRVQALVSPGKEFGIMAKLTVPSEVTAREGKWIPFEFAAVGTSSFLRLGSVTYPPILGGEILESGGIQLHGNTDFRNLEVLILDGLPEDEARGMIMAPTEDKKPTSFIVWQKLPMPRADVLSKAGSAVSSNGELHVVGGTPIPNFKARNLSVRGEVKLDPESTGTYVVLRGGPMSRQVTLNPDNRDIWITMPQPGGDNKTRRTIAKLVLPETVALLTEDWLPFEFSVVGRQSFLRLGGTSFPMADGDDTVEAGDVRFGNNASFRHLEALSLDPLSDAQGLKRLEEEWEQPLKVAPPRPTAKIETENAANAIWKARWHKPGRLRAAGTTAEGKPFDLTAAGLKDDFVQVMALSPKIERGRSWLALSADDAAVMSDGATDTGFVGIMPLPVKKGGYVNAFGKTIVTEPVTAFSHNSAKFHAASPGIEAWADVQGGWHVRSRGYDENFIARPDVASPPAATKVVCGNSGTAVLRADDRLRIWNKTEVRLPDELADGIKDVVSMGIPWAVLKVDGRVLRFEVAKAAANGLDPLPAAEQIRELEAGPAIALRDTGYGCVWKLKSGRWTMGADAPLEPTLQALFAAGNESFDIFSDGENAGILWIEPRSLEASAGK